LGASYCACAETEVKALFKEGLLEAIKLRLVARPGAW
jgi:hypothetical protein